MILTYYSNNTLQISKFIYFVHLQFQPRVTRYRVVGVRVYVPGLFVSISKRPES